MKLTQVFGIFATILSISDITSAVADDVQVTVQPDRTEISQDESLSLKFTIRSEGTSAGGAATQFSAPDFQVINEYAGTYVESFYENGRFGVRNNQQVTKVLKPLKTGLLRITGISVRVAGRAYTHPGVDIRVTPGGGGTPPPRGYGGVGMGLRGSGKRANGLTFFVRAEVDKQRAYKGEQIIVSYYLYQRVRTFNIQVEKYPSLQGFLREDLEMPVLGQRLDAENVVLDGVPYSRALLVRYAAYPLKEGKLTIDPMALKANYYGNQGGADDDPFMNFFQQLSPRASSVRSEPLTVEAASLPEAGRPDSFSGGVGDFTVASAVNRYDVRANEAITLTLKIEGKGNVAAIQEPKAKWPENVELYEAKGNAKSGKGGVGQKVFEFLLIPRVPGTVTLPPLEVSFFDPAKQQYVTKSTEPIQVTVGDAAPGSAVVPMAKRPDSSKGLNAPAGATPAVAGAADDFHYLKPLGDATAGMFRGHPWWRWLYWLSICGFLGFFGLVGLDIARGRIEHERSTRDERLLAESKSWQKLNVNAKAAIAGAPWNDVTQTYELLSGAVYDAIDGVYPVGARSISRSELRQYLVDEKGLPAPIWQRLDHLLDFAETVRFASSAGAITEGEAREQLSRWVKEGQSIAEAMQRQGLRNTNGQTNG